MYSINGTEITLTKGDSFNCEITLKNEDGTNYTPTAGDLIRFTMKRSTSESTVLISKTVPVETLILHLSPSDTANLPVRTYVYDMEIVKESGDVFTFIPVSKFILTEELGR